MADTYFYHCFVCGMDITSIVNPTGFYTCPYCGAVQYGKPVNSTNEPVKDIIPDIDE